MPNPVDHLVYAVPDLMAGVAEFARQSEIEPVPGGRHLGQGTANYLVGLGHGRYLEIIGPDPDSDVPPSLFGLDIERPARLVTWAVRTTAIDRAVASARALGYDPGAATDLSRQAGTTLLRWRLTAAAGIRPFLIDWGSSPHPSTSGLPAVELLEFTVSADDPRSVRAQLAALESTVPVEQADRDGLRARLGTPAGPITLTT